MSDWMFNWISPQTASLLSRKTHTFPFQNIFSHVDNIELDGLGYFKDHLRFWSCSAALAEIMVLSWQYPGEKLDSNSESTKNPFPERKPFFINPIYTTRNKNLPEVEFALKWKSIWHCRLFMSGYL